MVIVLRNRRLALLVAAHVGFILLGSLAAMVPLGWHFSLNEAMVFTVIIGFSIDFVLHIAVAYSEATAERRFGRCAQALDELLPAISKAAFTTLVMGTFTLRNPMLTTRKFGIFIIINVAIAYATTVLPFVAALLLFGPEERRARPASSAGDELTVEA